MSRRNLFKDALVQVEGLLRLYPSDSALNSIMIQLNYLIDLEDGRRNDRDRLNDISIGLLTVREIEPLDENLASTLYRMVEEVEQMKQA